jgi:hypothetical protein
MLPIIGDVFLPYHLKGWRVFPFAAVHSFPPAAPGWRLLLLPLVLVFGGIGAAQDDAPPDTAGQERILSLMRDYAASYRIPDVTFDRAVTISRRRGPSETWREVFQGENRRIAHDGREYLCCRNGKDRKPIPNQWVPPWSVPGSGEFPWDGSKATVTWVRWDVVRGHRVAVFDYSVSAQDSHWILPNFRNDAVVPRSDGVKFSGPVTDFRGSAVLPYSGNVWVDPSTGAIWRTSTVTGEPPARSRIRSSSGTTDYDLLTLGTTQHLLRVANVTVVGTDRVETLFRNYRKFEADSSITFFGTDSTVIYRN